MAFISIKDPQNPQNQHAINLDNVVSIKREVNQQTRDGYEHVVVIAHTYSVATKNLLTLTRQVQRVHIQT